MDRPLTVLCITGWCRNGSTIIGNILNEVPGITHVGELHFLWKNAAGQGANSRCGCGRPLTGCQLWAEVLEAGRPPGTELADFAADVVARQRRAVRTRHAWRVRRWPQGSEDLRAHASLLARTYQAIAEQTGAQIVVDTSKMPAESALLPHLPGIKTYYVHLVRDPRAVAGSWHEPKDYVHALTATASTAYWTGFNLAAAAITRRYRDRSVLVRYEEFIAGPQHVISRLLGLAGADQAANPVHGRVADLGVNHTVTGNPDRFRTGQVTIRDADDAWTASLPLRARLAVVALSWPLARRYGYRYAGTLARPEKAGEAGLDTASRQEERAVGPGA